MDASGGAMVAVPMMTLTCANGDGEQLAGGTWLLHSWDWSFAANVERADGSGSVLGMTFAGRRRTDRMADWIEALRDAPYIIRSIGDCVRAAHDGDGYAEREDRHFDRVVRVVVSTTYAERMGAGDYL